MVQPNYLVDNTPKLWSPPLPLTGHCFCYGRIGGGKTCKMLTMAQFYHQHGYKIWDISGGKRGEGMFWAFPNDDEKLWEAMRKETYDFKGEAPKQYKVNILYPCFKSRLPKELPQ